MATSKTNWGAILLLIGIAAIVWYWLKGRPAQAAGGAGAASPLSQYPVTQPGTGNDTQRAIPMPPSKSSGLLSGIGSALSSLFGGNKNNSNALALSTTSTSPSLDALSIPLEPLQTMTDLPSWTANDPNAPWNSISTDFATTSDTGSLTIPSDSYDWGGFSPSDFLVTQSLPGDTGVSSDYTGGDSSSSDFIDSGDLFQTMLDSSSIGGGYGDMSIGY